MCIKIKSAHATLLTIIVCFSLLSCKKICASEITDMPDTNNSDVAATSAILIDQNIAQLKEYLEKDISADLTYPAGIEQFISSILSKVTALQPKCEDIVIGIAFNDVAEKFSNHDYFSVDRFDSTLTAAQQKIENARLMHNWQKWYTYKLLSYFYKKEAITEKDKCIIDKSMRSDDLDIYRSDEYYEQVYVPGKPFYDNKNNFGQDVYIELAKQVEDFSSALDSLNAAEDETDTI